MSQKMVPLPTPREGQRYNVTLAFRTSPTKKYYYPNVLVERTEFHLHIHDTENNKRLKYHQYALVHIELDECQQEENSQIPLEQEANPSIQLNS